MFKKGIKIKNLIGLTVIVAILITAVTTGVVSNIQIKKVLTDSRLEQNYQYSKNVAESTSLVLNDMRNNLETLAQMMGTEEFTQRDLDNWLDANDHYFNSLFSTDETGVVQFMSPLDLSTNENQVQPGTRIQSPLMEQALENQVPFISDPYYSQTGVLMLLVSQPIFDENGQYIGVVDGTIYLEEVSSLGKQLSRHDFLEESTVFVVDRSGKIIYHPDSKRINDDISAHPLIKKVTEGNDGSSEIVNRLGEEYFSGFSHIEDVGWGVVTQTPVNIIDEPLNNLRKEMVIQSLPGIVIILLIALFSAYLISRPINQLSQYSRETTLANKVDIDKPNINTLIYEVRELNNGFQRHLEHMNSEIQVDGLTNLYNRRTFDYRIQELVEKKQKFSLILLDIDHFKNVNDTFGHLVGDDVIRFIADLMKETAKEDNDIKCSCYRYGGEEYACIIEDKTPEEAFRIAEVLREKVATTLSPTGQAISISIGIARCCAEKDNPLSVINRADLALYYSKQNGRNQTTIYSNEIADDL